MVEHRPVYLQLADWYEQQITTGAIKPGETLPAVQEIAREHQINRNTAWRAIRTLQDRGLVQSRRGAGTVATRREDANSVENTQRSPVGE